MKSILLPTDFSHNAFRAMHYAMKLFKDERCVFYLLNVKKVSSFVSDDLMLLQPSATIYQNLIKAAKRDLNTLVEDFKRSYDNGLHTFQISVDYDDFLDAINQMVKSKGIDMIVMGTKGSTGAEHVLFGSHTLRVMQGTTCPVLAIPQCRQFKVLKKIVFTSAYHTEYKKEELSPLLYLAKSFDAEVYIFHLMDAKYLTKTESKNKAFLDELLSPVKHRFVDVQSKNLLDTVCDYAQEENIDLLAMMNRKHTFLERLLGKHNLDRFALHACLPFLVMDSTGAYQKD